MGQSRPSLVVLRTGDPWKRMSVKRVSGWEQVGFGAAPKYALGGGLWGVPGGFSGPSLVQDVSRRMWEPAWLALSLPCLTGEAPHATHPLNPGCSHPPSWGHWVLYCYQCMQRPRRQSVEPVTSERYCATDRSRMRAQEGLEG